MLQVRLNDIAAETLFIAGKPQTISIGLPFVRLTPSGSFQRDSAAGNRGLDLTACTVFSKTKLPKLRMA